MLIAIEGIDGSGKGTQARLLTEALKAQGLKTQLMSFPRYEETFFGGAIGQFLNGEFGTLSEANPFLVSLLFAGDRYESRDLLRAELAENDIVILDRYVSSNIAHQGSKLPTDQQAALFDFVDHLEFGVYELPRPTLNLLLDLPAQTAQELIGNKNARSYTEKSHDLQESDQEYLNSVRELYLALARNNPEIWEVIECLEEDRLRSIQQISQELLKLVLQAA